LCRASRSCTGNFFIDEEVLRAEGVTDFSRYASSADGGPLTADFFIPAETFRRSPTRVAHGL
jgi:citronellol/citronellal dehydrogenase